MSGPVGLRVRLRRVSPTHHRFEVERDGATEGFELETRSTLRHDLVHYAVEAEAGLHDGFFGLLASGSSYAQLTAMGTASSSLPIASIERVVAALQGAQRSPIEPAVFVRRLGDYHEALGEPVPGWLTAELVARANARLRALEGAWRATPFGEALELCWPPSECRPPAGGTPAQA